MALKFTTHFIAQMVHNSNFVSFKSTYTSMSNSPAIHNLNLSMRVELQVNRRRRNSSKTPREKKHICDINFPEIPWRSHSRPKTGKLPTPWRPPAPPGQRQCTRTPPNKWQPSWRIKRLHEAWNSVSPPRFFRIEVWPAKAAPLQCGQAARDLVNMELSPLKQWIIGISIYTRLKIWSIVSSAICFVV